MADLTGWHPDPGGSRGRFRYWDGTRWSAETTGDPNGPAPSPPPPDPSRSRPSRGPVVAAVIGGIVVLLLLGLVVRNLVLGVWPITIDPAPPPTVIGGDDSSPSPTPPPIPTPTPTISPSTPSPTPGPRSTAPLVPCPLGIPNLRAAHPVDGRVYGGNLSFPAEPTYRPATPEPRMTFAFDVVQQQLPVSTAPGWLAQLAVGQLRAESGYVNDARNTADSLASCVATGRMYSLYDPVVAGVRSEAATVSGRQGWLIESEIRVTAPGLAFAGDRAVFVVVPDGNDWGFFFGASPIGDTGLNAILDRTVADLQAT